MSALTVGMQHRQSSESWGPGFRNADWNGICIAVLNVTCGRNLVWSDNYVRPIFVNAAMDCMRKEESGQNFWSWEQTHVAYTV